MPLPRPVVAILLAFSLSAALLVTYTIAPSSTTALRTTTRGGDVTEIPAVGIIPEPLVNLTYRLDQDFLNSESIRPPYWIVPNNNRHHWGPCEPPQTPVEDWTNLNTSRSTYPAATGSTTLFPNMCRPGFLIIGAGKCGTSSLYHYLTQHPRVLPAKEKQIHYFKYYRNYGLEWYYRHFPSTEYFLKHGALLTGEASPGYLPYPEVATAVRHDLPNGPRILCIGREPLDRAYSSYRYNYVEPTLQRLKKGWKHVEGNREDEYYQAYLFSFQDMIAAELQRLQRCLSPNGTAIVKARKKHQHDAFRHEYQRRREEGLPPMADLDAFCYGGKVNSTVLRGQWSALVAKYPDKVILDKNLHLTQSFIGRGLYTLPLEWWYATFAPDDLYFVCTEELKDLTGQPLEDVASFLGLPSFDFADVVAQGAYNVGGHRGYDEEVSWETVQNASASTMEIPISDELRSEFYEFVRPYNERLFALVGKRCDW